MSKGELREVAEKIRKKLVQLGYKVTKPRSSARCVEIGAESANKIFFVYIFEGEMSDNLIVKLTMEPKGCEEALLSPKGLFIIDKDVEGIIIRLSDKLKLLEKIRNKTLI